MAAEPSKPPHGLSHGPAFIPNCGVDRHGPGASHGCSRTSAKYVLEHPRLRILGADPGIAAPPQSAGSGLYRHRQPRTRARTHDHAAQNALRNTSAQHEPAMAGRPTISSAPASCRPVPQAFHRFPLRHCCPPCLGSGTSAVAPTRSTTARPPLRHHVNTAPVRPYFAPDPEHRIPEGAI
jgi:hypothetical protein